MIITGWRNRKPAPKAEFSTDRRFTGATLGTEQRAVKAMAGKPPGRESIAPPEKVKSRKASI